MEPASAAPIVFWPLGLYFGAVVAVVAGMLGVSFVLGQSHNDRSKGEPYESGIVATGTARVRFAADFFLVAVFFVIFDLESLFVFAWATSARELGWYGYGQICAFVGVVFASLLYLWREKALDT